MKHRAFQPIEADAVMIDAIAQDLSSPPRGKLLFTIGLPRSGKSTHCTKWVRDEPRLYNVGQQSIRVPRAIVCGDSIRLALHGAKYNYRSESIIFAIKHYMIEALLSRGHDVIVDGTHTTRMSIRRNLEIDVAADYVLIATPCEECKRRASEAGDEYLLPTIDRCYNQLHALQEYGLHRTVEEIREETKIRSVTWVWHGPAKRRD